VKLVTKNFKITDALNEYVKKKMNYFQKNFAMTDITITLVQEKNNFTAQFLGTYPNGNTLIKVKANAFDAYSAIDKLQSICKGVSARTKDYHSRMKRKEKSVEEFREPVRRVKVSVMTHRDALDKMFASNYHFWFYIDKDNGLFTVVYQKDDGGTGVIHPIFE